MIWCVEDDSSIRDIEVYALTATGFEAISASTELYYSNAGATLLGDRTYGYIHVSTDGQLDYLYKCFVNDVAVNMGYIYLFELVLSFYLDKSPEVEMLGHLEVLLLIF